jgi:hypothetical protein
MLDGWTAQAVRPLLLAGALLLGSGAGVAQQQAFEPREETPEEFPDFPGREDTFYFCSACHAFKLVAQQGMSRRRWDGTLDLMTERHGMPKVEGRERSAILDYLEKAFPESAEPRGWQNPFLKQ